MAAEKKGQTIVIKKIYVTAGHHGGAWKVALADFMTAMMAFFLVMWLLGQTPATKKAVSDYFSTPSVVEYNFQNYGVEVTLEKLFLDFMNEPLQAIQSFMEPMDKTPNVFDFGSQKVVAAYMADKMGDIAKNVSISPDGIEFDIPDFNLFKPGTSDPKEEFVVVMTQLQSVVVGLQDSTITIESRLFHESVSGSQESLAKKVSLERLDLVRAKIQSSLENPSNEIVGVTQVQAKKGFVEGYSDRPHGFLHMRIQQKPTKFDGTPTRKLETLFGSSSPEMNVYDNFVKQISNQRKKTE